MKLLDPKRPVLVNDDHVFADMMARLPDAAAVDLETSMGENRLLNRPITMQLYWGDRPYMVTEKYLPRLKPWLESKPLGIFYSAKGDMHNLQNSNLPWQGPIHDALVVDYMCDENVKVVGIWEESLKARHGTLFNHEPRKTWKKMFGKKGADAVIAEEGYDRLLPYGCEDVVETWDVYHHQKARLEKLEWVAGDNMFQHFQELEAPYTRVLYNMERRGCQIDQGFLEELRGKADRLLEDAEYRFYTKARELANEKFDSFVAGHKELGHSDLISSPIQLGQLFYDVIGYPEKFLLKKDKESGRKHKVRTSNVEALEELAEEGHELPMILSEWRKTDKLKGTYVIGLLERLYRQRLHTDFIQAFTLTGRLSSRDPNLQNIPRPENDPFGIRHAFITSTGMRILCLDYSQIEVRIAAHMSGDPDLIAACKHSDIYVAMAMLLFPGKPTGFWAKPKEGAAGIFRQTVKAIVLGLLFGKQAESIARELRISERKAQGFIDQFFLRFPRLRAFMKRQVQHCRQVGHVRTITGRYRNIPEISSYNKWIRSHAERQALNSPIQGSAFDVIEQAQLNIESSGLCKEYGGYMLLSVHDELVFEFPVESVREVKPKLQEIMMHPFKQDLRVPLPVAGDIGHSWGEAK